MRNSVFPLLIAMMVSSASPAWAAHPLITDDAGTQGTGKFQVEVNGALATDKEDPVERTGVEVGAAVTAGIRDDLDLVVGVPYLAYETKINGSTVADAQGPGDVVVEAKWRFFEQDGLSLAVKPGIALPTGDEDKGLGTGETGVHLFLIATKETEPVTLHGNVGYIRNENNRGEEKNLWHLSLAAEHAVAERIRIVGNIGAEKNPDPLATDDPAFGLIGVIVSPKENMDLDAGVKIGLTDSEDDFTFLAGVAYRF